MIKGMISAIIPNRNSPFLNNTIKDLLNNAGCEIEVIVNVDENWPDQLLNDPRITYIHPARPIGMRAGINACAALAKGEFLLKSDGHNAFGKDFGKILIENHLRDNWVQIPRRYSLDAENWQINKERPYHDYMALCFPLKGKEHDWGMHGIDWKERQSERNDKPEFDFDIDDTPSMQGSCWFMTKNHFDNFLHGMSEKGYGYFSQEAQEIGNKTWLGGGALRINKKTWYAHLHKGKQYGRMYSIDGFGQETIRSSNWSAYYWMQNMWKERKHDMEWLVDRKFPHMPTWPENWKEVWKKQVEEGWPNI